MGLSRSVYEKKVDEDIYIRLVNGRNIVIEYNSDNDFYDTYVYGLEIIYDLTQAGLVEKVEKKSEADMMFEKMEYQKSEINYASDINIIRYSRDSKYATNVDFYTNGNTIKTYYGDEGMAGHIKIDVLKAINKKCEELGWI